MAKSRQQEILAIVKCLLDPGDELTADDLDSLEDEFSQSINHPAGAALLHYPEDWGLGKNPTADEIVNAALNWVPIVLAMRIKAVRPHCRQEGLYAYEVEAKNTISTQVVSEQVFSTGDVCAVALSGVTMPDGHIVQHGFVEQMYSAGEILGKTDVAPGTELNVNGVLVSRSNGFRRKHM